MSSVLPSDLVQRLPHGPAFRFVSRVTAITPRVQGQGVWEVTGRESFFEGHFPGDPIVPGVLLGEALAQMAGLVGLCDEAPEDRPGGGVLAQIDLRLRRPVRPPASIELSAKFDREMGPLHQFTVRATCGGQVVAKGSLTIASVTPDNAAPAAGGNHE